MKRIIVTILCVLLGSAFCASCATKQQLPPDYVSGTKVVIDNETPFVYDESTYHDEALTTILRICIENPDKYSFEDFIARSGAGNKIVRHYVKDDVENYYTIYASANNYLDYIFLEKKGDRYICKEFFLFNTFDDNTALKTHVFEYDLPSAILGDRKPDWAVLENYTIQEINERIEQRWHRYSAYCKKVELNGLVEDMFDSAEKPLEYVYRTVQYKTFDTTTDNRWGSGGIYNYDLLLYKDGSADLIYRHFDEGKPYTLLREMHLALNAEDLSRIQTTLTEWDFESIPTWNPEEPMGLDGETTYILGQAWNSHPHLASMWSADERYGIYHIRTAFEEIVRAHEPESIFDAFLSGEAAVSDNGASRYIGEFYPEGKGKMGNGYAYLHVVGDENLELLLRTPTSYTIIANGENGLHVYYTGNITEEPDDPYNALNHDEITWLLYE